MKKSLIALAAMAAVGAASAQSSVTLYGIIDTGFGYTSDRVTYTHPVLPDVISKTTDIGFISGGASSSRWGLKGEEDLGNGLAAVFNIETGFDSTTGAGSGSFTRRSIVGLKGGFGQVALGLDYTPVDAISGDYVAVGVNEGSFYTGRATGIHYSGNFSGVKVAALAGYDSNKQTVQVGTGVGSVNTVANTRSTVLGVGVGFETGPFSVGTAAQMWSNRGGYRRYEYGLGFSYDLTAAKLFTHYMGRKVKGQKIDHQAGVGVSVPMGAFTLSAQYAYSRFRSGENLDVFALSGANYSNAAMRNVVSDVRTPLLGGTPGIVANGHELAIRGSYAFSKRTDMYVNTNYRTLSGKSNGTTNLVGYKFRNLGFNFGLRHKF